MRQQPDKQSKPSCGGVFKHYLSSHLCRKNFGFDKQTFSGLWNFPQLLCLKCYSIFYRHLPKWMPTWNCYPKTNFSAVLISFVFYSCVTICIILNLITLFFFRNQTIWKNERAKKYLQVCNLNFLHASCRFLGKRTPILNSYSYRFWSAVSICYCSIEPEAGCWDGVDTWNVQGCPLVAI